MKIKEEKESQFESEISKQDKIKLVKNVLNKPKDGLEELRELAVSHHGLCKEELRKKAWPLLLGLNPDVSAPPIDDAEMMSHSYNTQVLLDVNRINASFPEDMGESQRNEIKTELKKLIMMILCHNQDLHYYQGFHDVCLTFLFLLGKELSFHVVNELVRSHLRDFMDPDMSRTRTMLNYLYPLLLKIDPDLHDYLQKSEVGTIFCLSWLITWYGHALENSKIINRLFDLFLATHPLMPMYLAAAIVLHRRDDIFNTECEMCFIHVLLSHLPEDLPYEQLISDAVQLYLHHPPETLAESAEFDYTNSATMKNYEHFIEIFGGKSVPDIPIRPLKLVPTSQSYDTAKFLSKVKWISVSILVSAAIPAAYYFMNHIAKDIMLDNLYS